MDCVPPPSSKRMRGTTTEIEAVIESGAMNDLFGHCIERVSGSRGVCLIVHPNDCFEVADFIKQIVMRLGLNPPRMIRPEANAVFSLQKNDVTHERGVVLLNADTLPFRVLPALAELLCEKGRPMLVIAQFSRMKGFTRAFGEWMPCLRKEFDPQPLVWPPLNLRGDDLPEIMNRVCAKLVSGDGLYRANLSKEARDVLLQEEYRSVGKLAARIRAAFDIALLEDTSQISPRHLAIANSPETLARLFAPPSASV